MRSLRLRPRPALRRAHDDPLALLVGLFDCALVLALGLSLTLSKARAPDDVPEQRRALQTFVESSSTRSRGEGVRLGMAYRLANGEVAYVPDHANTSSRAR